LSTVVDKQQESTPLKLSPSPLLWGDADALAARARHYADSLLVSWEVACLLATTPLPISWVAQVFDQLQLRTMNARVRGREDRLVQQTWALLAMAADGLAGTGQLPAPHLAWRWCDVCLPMTSVPATKRIYHSGDRDDQDARIRRQAYWDAAEEGAGTSHAGGMPVERFIPGWDVRQALREITGVDWWGSSGRRFQVLTRRSRQRLPGRVRAPEADWRRTMLDETARRLAIRVPGWRPSWQSKPGHMRRWFLAGDLAQRCRWRAVTLAGDNALLAEQLERRLLRDALDRYVLGTVPHELTVLPAQAAWRDSVHRSAWPVRSWTTRPDVADGSVAHLVMLGYTPARLRRDDGLRHASAEELAMAAALTGSAVFS
ncbi:hypothetical protein, partial [Blastococcus sp. CCUG 61487]|uniref:hypothetical protein n=1 Tax=Blastococcus sp. CCUG 61487 TaxID=1840703 RepID=UPI00148539FD